MRYPFHQTSHASATMHSGPGVELDDGVFTIYVVRDMSRFELLQVREGSIYDRCI